MRTGRPRVYGPSPWPDCGTPKARRRHYGRREQPCADCRADRAPLVGESEIRDPVTPYRYRARRYPWAERVLAASEARYGRPDEEEAA